MNLRGPKRCPINDAILNYSINNPHASFASIAEEFGVTRNKVAGALWRRGRDSIQRIKQIVRENDEHSH